MPGRPAGSDFGLEAVKATSTPKGKGANIHDGNCSVFYFGAA